MKRILLFLFFLLFVIFTPTTFARTNNYVSVVNPIRGNDFWDLKDQRPETAVLGQIEILKKFNLAATWLIRFDVLDNKNIISAVERRLSDEKGLFLEVTPVWADQAKVTYHKSASWHSAGSAFLTGYERPEREKLIDTAFKTFKETFGFYPVSVGAWWIDGYSLGYMQKKYGITGALIVADQYSTDNYQIWGQYFGTPYYPAKNNALHPAQSLGNKLDIVMMQWAPRDPVNAYGNGVNESTFSIQANDYIDYHDLDIGYFSSLVDIYTKQQYNRFNHLVVGLENSYDWKKYGPEYQRQIEVLSKKQINIVTMKNFAQWYKKNFPEISSEQMIISDDTLGSFKKAIWLMNPYYRVVLFINQEGAVFRDIRQYIDGEEELCFKNRCDSLNFATSATRVLDDVSFGQRWVVDQGKISNFKVIRNDEKFVISYNNEAGNLRQIGLLPRDISIDEKTFSIDSAILNATTEESKVTKSVTTSGSFLKWSLVSVIVKLGEFFIFLLLGVIVPGFILTNKIFKDKPIFLRLFISCTVGFVALTLLFYITSLLHFRPLIFGYILLGFIIFIRLKLYNLLIDLSKVQKYSNVIIVLMILAGTVFQVTPTFKSGLNFSYGMGLWGPNTHDAVWHMALVNQLIKSVPAENPVYAGVTLKNYHFFYDLLIAATNYISTVPVADLIFRFYPVFLSLMLGIGSYYLTIKLFRSKIASLFSLYLIYFAGSFGWIVEFLRERHIGGESAFWANQSISFNLNPPFAISLIIIIALFHIVFNLSHNFRLGNIFLAIFLTGSLIGFKSYGAILVLAVLLIVGLIRKQISYLVIFMGALLISILIFLPNFDVTSNLLILVPFWFIHAMIDSPDRVGWVRITLARETGFANNWFKFISAEVLSLIIFIAGNLGMRVVSLLSLIKIKSIIKDEKLLFIFIFALLSFLIPTLFIQSGNPWNTIQFSYYGIYIAALISGIVISKLPVFIIFIIMILAPINSVVTAGGYFGKNPHAYVSSKEIAGLQFLSDQPDGMVLTYPYDDKLKQKLAEPWPVLAYDSTAYVSAFSKKAVYLEDEPQNQILLTDYKKRLIASKNFFLKPLTESIKFLQDNHIKYIYLPKISHVKLDENTNIVKNIFENKEMVIYKLNP